VAGKPIRIEGLAATINETLVRFRFRDGSIVTRILMPEAPRTEFPSRAARSEDPDGPATASPRGIRAVVADGVKRAMSDSRGVLD
jgi:hypothetical protein